MRPQVRRLGPRRAGFGCKLAALLFPCAVAGIPHVLGGCSDVGDSTALPGENPGTTSLGSEPDADERLESTDAESTLVDGSSGNKASSPGLDASSNNAGDATIAEATSDASATTGVDVYAQEDASSTTAADSGQEEETSGPGSGGGASDATADSTVADAEPRDAEEADARPDAATADSGAEQDAGVDSGTRSDAAAEDASAHDSGGTDAAETGHLLAPCTSAGQTDCVNCMPYNTSGLCTATEAQFVQLDIDAGLATTAGEDPGSGCYSCLVNAGCLDDNEFGDVGHECGVGPGGTTSDLPATFVNGSGVSVDSTSTCLATIQCILSTACGTTANGGLTNCYCGTEGGGPTACSTATSVNGACEAQELAGFSHTDNSDIVNKDFTNTLEPSGMANEIFSCGKETCVQCFQ